MKTQPSPASKRKNILWLIALVLVGGGIFFAAPLLKKGPQKIEVVELAVKVRAITISAIDVVPRAIGYGKVEPERTWDAVAEVAGQVVWIADELRDGRIVKAGVKVLRIEDANYQLTLTQIGAQINASRVKNQTARDALLLADKELVLLQADFDRKIKLAKNGTVSQATVHAAERPLLSGQARVANLQNSLKLISAEHQVLIAQQNAAKLDLARTHMVAPFDARITNVQIGVAQYANKGQLLFSADGLNAAEITAQFSVGILRPLIAASQKQAIAEIRPGAMALQAVVRLQTSTHSVEWPAKVSRVSGVVDPQTQSLGVVVSIERPTELAKPGERPPLFRNTFVEVELHSTPIEKQIVVPLNAIHQGHVYVINDETRLEMRKITIMFSQQGYAVLKNGLKAGERIVTSDLVSALEGMLLEPQPDKKSTRNLIMQATGKEPAK